MTSFKKLIFEKAKTFPNGVVINGNGCRFICKSNNNSISISIETMSSEYCVEISNVDGSENYELIKGYLDSLEDIFKIISVASISKDIYPDMNKFIYLICPVRNISPSQQTEIADYVRNNEIDGVKFHYPPRDVDQSDSTGYNICVSHREAMEMCDEVHIFWDSNSKGSHFDLGMAFALHKKIKLVKCFDEDGTTKSYVKVMKEIEDRQVV